MKCSAHDALVSLRPGDHACWVVKDPREYEVLGTAVLRAAANSNEMPVMFGPDASGSQGPLSQVAVMSADPRIAFLDGGSLNVTGLCGALDSHLRLARSKGFDGIRVVADMDWLAPAEPSANDLIAFELLLDRTVQRLGSTVVCAYRTSTFDGRAVSAAGCVHPVWAAHQSPPQFTLVAGEDGRWMLAGEVDVMVRDAFRTALRTAANNAPCIIDASDVEFLDVAALREIVQICSLQDRPLRVVNAPRIVLRAWRALRLAEHAMADLVS